MGDASDDSDDLEWRATGEDTNAAAAAASVAGDGGDNEGWRDDRAANWSRSASSIMMTLAILRAEKCQQQRKTSAWWQRR